MPENAVDPQAWKRAANALVANFLYYYQYNGNTVEYCVEIVKQEAADGQGEAADYMVIFAKKHDGEEWRRNLDAADALIFFDTSIPV